MSTYSDLKILLIGTGEEPGTWGSATNLNLGTALEEAIVGTVDVTFASGDVTLTLTDTNATQTARHVRLRCTGTTGGARNLILGSGCQIGKPYIISNDCADAITVKNTTGTGIAVAAGKTMWVYNNGTNVVDVVTHLTSLTLANALPAGSGGTGVANGVNNTITFTGNYSLGLTLSNNTTLTLPTTGTLATLAGSETLTNKTLTLPVISAISNTGTLTLPTSSTTLVGRDTTDTLTNKSISGSANTLSNIANASLTNSSVTFNGVAVALGASGTITAASPNALTIGTGLSGTSFNGSSAVTIAIDATVATLTGSQTLTNKTLTSPVISTISNTGTLTLPTASTTLVGRDTTDTLTNKSISGSTNTLSNIANASLTNSSITINGSAVSLGGSITVTGATSSTLTIGTGLSGSSFNGSSPVTIAIDSTVATLTGSQTLTNKTISGSNNTITNVSLTAGVTGTLPAGNGGTGITSLGSGVATWLGTPSSANLASAVTDETGSGSLVFASSPTLTTPRLAGSSTGYSSFASANSSATNYTITFPAENMTVGYRNIPNVGTKSSSYQLATGDVGKYVQVTSGGSITVPNSTFADGDAITIFNNNSSGMTITLNTTTAYISGSTSNKGGGGTVTLGSYGIVTILFYSATACVLSGSVT